MTEKPIEEMDDRELEQVLTELVASGEVEVSIDPETGGRLWELTEKGTKTVEALLGVRGPSK